MELTDLEKLTTLLSAATKIEECQTKKLITPAERANYDNAISIKVKAEIIRLNSL